MRISRVYTNQALEQGTSIMLPQEQSHYLANVLRQQTGDTVILFNGTDYEYEATLIHISKKQAELKITGCIEKNVESPLQIHLAIGLAKGGHMDLAIQKAVELGVHRIIPVITEFSNVRIKADRLQNKMNHWSSIIISAAEQCGRTKLAILEQPVKLDAFLASEPVGQRLLFHPEADTTFAELDGKPDNVTLLTGPEGGFSTEEVALARDSGFKVLGLGPRILRAETAVISALACCQARWGDLDSMPK